MIPSRSSDSFLTLSASPSTSFWARRHIDAVMDKWSITPVRYITELVTTELVTNAVKASGVEIDAGWGDMFAMDDTPNRRGRRVPRTAEGMLLSDFRPIGPQPVRCAERRTPPVVRLHLSFNSDAGKLLVEVWDQNPEPPEVRRPELTDEGGRGLLVIGTICERWGWYWPSSPLRERQPWPRANVRAGSGDGGQFGKVVWGVLTVD